MAKTPDYLNDARWTERVTDVNAPECKVWTYILWANEYNNRDEVEGTIEVVVDDFGVYRLVGEWQYSYGKTVVENWSGDQKTLDKLRKVVAAGVRRAVTETNSGGRAQRHEDYKEHLAWR